LLFFFEIGANDKNDETAAFKVKRDGFRDG